MKPGASQLGDGCNESGGDFVQYIILTLRTETVQLFLEGKRYKSPKSLQIMETEPESHKSAHENAGPRLPSGAPIVLHAYPLNVGFSPVLSTTNRKEI